MLSQIPSGDEGTFVILGQVQDAATRGSLDPRTIELARELAGAARSRDHTTIALVMREWLRSVWRYLDDPSTREYVSEVSASLDQLDRSGKILGDCDDLAALAGALAMDLNIPVQFEVISLDDVDPWTYSHVAASLLTEPDGGVSMDILRPESGPVPRTVRRQTVTLGASQMATLHRRPAVGSNIIDLVSGLVPGGSSIATGVETLLGATSGANMTQAKQAGERARINSYLAGIAAGSVLSGQLLLGIHESNTDSFTQQLSAQAIADATSNHADVMSEARAEGSVRDQADGYQGLSVLSNLGVRFVDPGAGYNTSTGAPPSGATAALVQQLASLPVKTAGQTAAGAPAKAGFPLWLALGLGGAAVYKFLL